MERCNVPCPYCGTSMLMFLVDNYIRGIEVRLYCPKCMRMYRIAECKPDDLINLEN